MDANQLADQAGNSMRRPCLQVCSHALDEAQVEPRKLRHEIKLNRPLIIAFIVWLVAFTAVRADTRRRAILMDLCQQLKATLIVCVEILASWPLPPPLICLLRLSDQRHGHRQVLQDQLTACGECGSASV